jgi:ERCC4-type nuclease
MLIAPTEPAELRAIGRVTMLPESMGADILIPHKDGFVGVQRKEYKDLLASLQDGRLYLQLAQMKRLYLAVLLIEGTPKWSKAGVLVQHARAKPWSKGHHRNLVRRIQAKGVWVEYTDSVAETIDSVKGLEAWLQKEGRSALDRRPGPPDRSIWGAADCREFQLHILQGFPGIGPIQAERIIEHFGGVPLQWTASKKELQSVPGMGRIKAARLHEALG